MLRQLRAPEGALIIMDAGIASEENLKSLALNKFKSVSSHSQINLRTNKATGLVTELTWDYQPQPANKQTHPGVYKLRVTLTDW
ncbi:MAG: hypothetical protein ACI9NQ_001800 [Paracoccaceae bacterium]|jgi:hypothetical protein